jgi:hypothetical protein
VVAVSLGSGGPAGTESAAGFDEWREA